MLLVVVLALFGSLLLGFSAQAATKCSTTVVDDANVFGKGFSKVQDAAETLHANGAEVRVVTANIPQGTTVDQYEQQYMRSCPELQGNDDLFSPSLVLFMAVFTPDGHGGLLFDYGSQFNPMFEGAYSQAGIQSAMLNGFRSKNYTKGFVDGINKANDGVEAYLNPESHSSSSAQPSGPSAAPKSIGIFFVGLIILVLICGAAWFFIRSQRRSEERKKMRQRAMSARDAATTINHVIGDPTRVTVRKAKVVKFGAVSENLARQLQGLAKTVELQYELSVSAMTSAAAAGNDVDNSKLTTGEYEQLAQRYEEALANSENGQAADNQIDQICEDAKAQLAGANETVNQLGGRLKSLQASLAGLQQEGIKVDTIQVFADDSARYIEEAQQKLGDLTVLSVISQATIAVEQGEAAEQRLVQQRAALSSGLPALRDRITQASSLVDPAKECFGRISSTYAQASWEPVQGNGTEAMNRIHDAEQALDHATEIGGIEQQQWSEAVEAMQAGNQLLGETESLLRSIHDLESSLATAREQAPAEIEAAADDIAKAGQYLRDYQGDVDPRLSDDLRTAQDMLAEARQEHGQNKPNYLLVVKLALQANQAADHIYAEAVDDHDAAERLRRKAATAITQASAASSTAESYIRVHSRDVASSAKSQLREAQSSLVRAQQSPDPSERLRWATQAENAANQAYRQAKRGFDDAERLREAERRRANDLVTGATIGSSSMGGYGNSGWGSSPSHRGSHSHGGGISSGGGGHHHGGGVGF